MNICTPHWTTLREKIIALGLGDLIAQGGETAAAQTADQLRRAEVTPVNFDPLMHAFWALASNSMRMIEEAGGDPLYLMVQGPPDPVQGYGEAGAGRTWPKCGVCYLGLVHELTCKGGDCELPHIDGYAWMLDAAADSALQQARELNLIS